MKLRKLLSFACLFLICTTGRAQKNGADSITVDAKKFTEVEVEAGYPGGDEAWRKFLMKYLKPEVPGKNGAPAGIFTVIAKFIVTKDGEVTDIAAETNIGYGAEEEVIRVIKKSGKWTPAMQNGRPVNAYRRQPITFAVETDAFNITTRAPYIFYSGTENQLSVDAYKINPENLEVTVSRGSIKQIAVGKYIVKVSGSERVTVEVFNTKKNKSLGTASFEVKEKK